VHDGRTALTGTALIAVFRTVAEVAAQD